MSRPPPSSSPIELFAAGSPADLIQRYARVLPLSVICELLGLPRADRPKFMAWARFSRFTGALGFLLALPKVMAMKRYIEGHVEAVRRQGGEGLIAEIVRVEREGGRISGDEIVSMVFLLLFAGHETTTHLISGSVHELLEATRPARLARRGLEQRRSRGGGVPALPHTLCSSPSRALCAGMSISAASR